MTDGWKGPVCLRGIAPTVTSCDHGGEGTQPVAQPTTPVPVLGGYWQWVPFYQPYYGTTSGTVTHGNITYTPV